MRALTLNARGAQGAWAYLRSALSCAGRLDLLGAADAEDLAALQRALPL